MWSEPVVRSSCEADTNIADDQETEADEIEFQNNLTNETKDGSASTPRGTSETVTDTQTLVTDTQTKVIENALPIDEYNSVLDEDLVLEEYNSTIDQLPYATEALSDEDRSEQKDELSDEPALEGSEEVDDPKELGSNLSGQPCHCLMYTKQSNSFLSRGDGSAQTCAECNSVCSSKQPTSTSWETFQYGSFVPGSCSPSANLCFCLDESNQQVSLDTTESCLSCKFNCRNYKSEKFVWGSPSILTSCPAEEISFLNAAVTQVVSQGLFDESTEVNRASINADKIDDDNLEQLTSEAPDDEKIIMASQDAFLNELDEDTTDNLEQMTIESVGFSVSDEKTEVVSTDIESVSDESEVDVKVPEEEASDIKIGDVFDAIVPEDADTMHDNIAESDIINAAKGSDVFDISVPEEKEENSTEDVVQLQEVPIGSSDADTQHEVIDESDRDNTIEVSDADTNDGIAESDTVNTTEGSEFFDIIVPAEKQEAPILDSDSSDADTQQKVIAESDRANTIEVSEFVDAIVPEDEIKQEESTPEVETIKDGSDARVEQLAEGADATNGLFSERKEDETSAILAQLPEKADTSNDVIAESDKKEVIIDESDKLKEAESSTASTDIQFTELSTSNPSDDNTTTASNTIKEVKEVAESSISDSASSDHDFINEVLPTRDVDMVIMKEDERSSSTKDDELVQLTELSMSNPLDDNTATATDIDIVIKVDQVDDNTATDSDIVITEDQENLVQLMELSTSNPDSDVTKVDQAGISTDSNASAASIVSTGSDVAGARTTASSSPCSCMKYSKASNQFLGLSPVMMDSCSSCEQYCPKSLPTESLWETFQYGTMVPGTCSPHANLCFCLDSENKQTSLDVTDSCGTCNFKCKTSGVERFVWGSATILTSCPFEASLPDLEPSVPIVTKGSTHFERTGLRKMKLHK